MSMQIMQAQLVQQRLLDDLMGQQAIRPAPFASASGMSAADGGRMSVRAVPGDIGNVVIVTRLHEISEHVVGDVLRFVPDLAIKLRADAL
jgi:hypothetical protein